MIDPTIKILLDNVVNSQAMLRVLLHELAIQKSSKDGKTIDVHFKELLDKVNEQRTAIAKENGF